VRHLWSKRRQTHDPPGRILGATRRKVKPPLDSDPCACCPCIRRLQPMRENLLTTATSTPVHLGAGNAGPSGHQQATRRLPGPPLHLSSARSKPKHPRTDTWPTGAETSPGRRETPGCSRLTEPPYRPLPGRVRVQRACAVLRGLRCSQCTRATRHFPEPLARRERGFAGPLTVHSPWVGVTPPKCLRGLSCSMNAKDRYSRFSAALFHVEEGRYGVRSPGGLGRSWTAARSGCRRGAGSSRGHADLTTSGRRDGSRRSFVTCAVDPVYPHSEDSLLASRTTEAGRCMGPVAARPGLCACVSRHRLASARQLCGAGQQRSLAPREDFGQRLRGRARPRGDHTRSGPARTHPAGVASASSTAFLVPSTSLSIHDGSGAGHQNAKSPSIPNYRRRSESNPVTHHDRVKSARDSAGVSHQSSNSRRHALGDRCAVDVPANRRLGVD